MPAARVLLAYSIPVRLRPAMASAMCCLVALPAAAFAQSVDYAAMEEMLGEPVTTSVTGKPQQASEAPGTLIIITREDIRRSPAHDVPGLIQAYAGIDVARWTQGQADIAIRGGVRPYNSTLLVLVNGRQVYLDHYGTTNWAGIGVQMDEIQQIEVVKGPNSALFGFNAAAGVVNIVTVDPREQLGAFLTVAGGTDDQQAVSGVATIPMGKGMGVRLSGGFSSADEYATLPTSRIAPLFGAGPDPRSYAAAVGFYGTIGDSTQFDVGVNRSDTRSIDFTPAALAVRFNYELTSVGMRVSHDTPWGVLSLKAFQNKAVIGSDIMETMLNDVFAMSADAVVRADTANTFRVAVEYRDNRMDSSFDPFGSTIYKVYAASGMWEAQFSDAATITAAGRIDNLRLHRTGPLGEPTVFSQADYDRSITAWSMNTAMLLSLGDRSSLRLSLAKGSEAPSLVSLGLWLVNQTLGPQPTSLLVTGNPFIDPANVWSAEAGVTHMLGTSSTRLEGTVFYNRTTNLMSQYGVRTRAALTPGGKPFFVQTAANVGAFDAFGAEAALSGRLAASWRWGLNYTWTRVNQHILRNEDGVLMSLLALDTATPKHKVKAQVSYERGPWLASVAGRYTSHTRHLALVARSGGAVGLTTVPDSVAVDAKVAFRFGNRLTLALTGENLTGARGVYLSPGGADTRLRAAVTVGF